METSGGLGSVGGIERQLALGVERREVVEIDAVTDHVRVVEIDRGQPHQREITLAVLRPADLALDRVAGAQPVLADLIGRDIDVVRAGKVIRFGTTQEAEPVLQHLDRAQSHDLVATLRLFLQDGEQQVLLAQRRRAFDAQFLGKLHQLGGRLLLQVFEMHGKVRMRASGGEGIAIIPMLERRVGTRQDAATRNRDVSGSLPPVKQGSSSRVQGFTITSTTISVTAKAGTSFSILSLRPSSVGFPRASFFA